MSHDYDLFTIGAGSGGVRASRVAASLGARVCVAELDRLGGTCVNVGCVPKKLMVYASEYARHLEDAARYGWTVGERSFDLARFRAAREREIERLNRVYGRLLHGAGCDVVRGRARIVEPHTVEVEGEGGTTRYTAERILVATGGEPVRPDIPGAERGWVSDDVFGLDAVPGRLLVVGAGYIGLEMACIFHGMGSEVTIAHRGSLPLRGWDLDLRAFVAEELRRAGIGLRLHTRLECLEAGVERAICAVFDHEEGLEVDAVLFATGRRPRTSGLGLEGVGVELGEDGAILVDERFRTSVESIYALGDVVGRLELTPVAIEEAIVFARQCFGDGAEPLDYEHVPTAVFSQPPVAAVGLTEEQVPGAIVYESDFRPMRHAITGREERAYMKLVVEPETERVRGVHLVGADAPEIIQGFAVALRCGVTKPQLDGTVGLHPTAAEELVTMREPRRDA